MKRIRVVVQDFYVKISYNYNSTRKRFPTGVKLESNSQITSDGILRGKMVEKEDKQKLITDKKFEIETAVNEFYRINNSYPTVKELIKLLEDKKSLNKVDSSSVVKVLEGFNAIQKDEFLRDDSREISSLSSHNSLLLYLKEYEHVNKKSILFSDIDKDWMYNFRLFLEAQRDFNERLNKRVKGGVKGATIKKRIGVFVRFLKWANEKGYCRYPKDLLNFTKTIGTQEIQKSTISREELIKLIELKIDLKHKAFIRDLFVFCCLTGMRWSDMMALGADDIVQLDQGPAIIMNAKKTKNQFTVFLTEESKAILERYEYNLNRITNPAYNRELKKFLASTGMFDSETKFIKDGRKLKRWEVMSIHRGRDSFITMLLSVNVPHNTIMQYTGHKQLRTLETYVDKNAKVVNFVDKLVHNV